MERGPLDRRRPRLILAVALAAVVAVGTFGAAHWQTAARPLDALGIALALVSPAVVALLPRRPVPAVLLGVGAVGTYLALGYAWGPVLAGAVGVLVMVLLTGPVARARALAWSGAALLWATVVVAAALRPDPPMPAVLVGGAAWTAVALLVAGAIRERFARAAALRAAREERERTAVATERLRIARELHDVLAHSLSAINVQAGVGLHLLDRDPAQARSALTSIRATSRDALDEVRAVLGVMRAEPGAGATDGGGDPSGARVPTWDLTTLDRLAVPLRDRGIEVSLDVTADDVPPHVAGVAYRVVQEALTNVARHAAGVRSVGVRVRRSAGGVHVRVSDDGDPAAPSAEPGYGLRGMRERVEGTGGTLVVGSNGSGFVVDATIPLPAGADGPAVPSEAGHEEASG